MELHGKYNFNSFQAWTIEKLGFLFDADIKEAIAEMRFFDLECFCDCYNDAIKEWEKQSPDVYIGCQQ